MFGGIGQELQCLEGQENNCNVSKDKATILIFERIRLEFQCLKEKGPNPVFGRIGPVFQCLEK